MSRLTIGDRLDQYLASKSHDIPTTQVQAVFFLDQHGTISECMGAVQQVSGYMANELCDRHISTLFPRFKDVELFSDNEINAKLNYLFHIGSPFRLDHCNGATRECLISMVNLQNGCEPRRILMTVSVVNQPAGLN